MIYGGGAITPDVVVQPDTLSMPEQQFLKAISPTSQEFYITLYNYGYRNVYELGPQLDPAKSKIPFESAKK